MKRLVLSMATLFLLIGLVPTSALHAETPTLEFSASTAGWCSSYPPELGA